MTDQTIQAAAHKIVYILVAEQGLRAGEGMTRQQLSEDLARHGISDSDQRAALSLAMHKGWLQKGPEDEVQLTEEGFDLDFTQ
ncbi:hypothetical protein [Comamonas guangdongensis]|uniref:Uncharacterized protein n=1 Tax=Comamonas guangdongensis TaxID=510515 RepID=A0ABV3ZVT6_9BURK